MTSTKSLFTAIPKASIAIDQFRRRCHSGIAAIVLMIVACLGVESAFAQGGDGDGEPGAAPTPEEQHDENESQTDPKKKDKEDGDPVTLFTGNLHVAETDLAIPGQGMDVEFRRTYYNGTSVKSLMGEKWDMNWFKRIVIQYESWVPYPHGSTPLPHNPFKRRTESYSQGASQMPVVGVYYFDGQGRVDRLSHDSAVKMWTLPEGHFAKVRAFGDDPSDPRFFPLGFDMRLADGTVMEFEARDTESPLVSGNSVTFWLTKVRNRQGQSIHIRYQAATDGFPGLVPGSMYDTLGREIKIGWSGGLLSSIDDHAGRSLGFEYDDSRLTSVKLPSTAKHPNGLEKRYLYGDPASPARGQLLKMIDAEEVLQTPDNPTPFLVNEYSGERVVAQQFGGVNKSGIQAGGRYLYFYDFPSTPRYWGWMTEAGRVLVVHPDGNSELTVFDREGFDILTYRFTGRLNPDDAVFSNPSSVLVSNLVTLNLTSEAMALNPSNNRLNVQSQYASAYRAPLRSSDPKSYVTLRSYNSDGLLTEEVAPGLRQTWIYDSANQDAFQRGNVLVEKTHPVPDNGSSPITRWRAYEPVYNQTRGVVDPRPFDPSYTPPNGGAMTVERYLTWKLFDYQEGDISSGRLSGYLADWEIDVVQSSAYSHLPGISAVLPSIPNHDQLGDLNSDSEQGQSYGNTIVEVEPRAQVFKRDSMADALPVSADQDARRIFQYNKDSLLVWTKDAEGGVTQYHYYPKSDPTGSHGGLADGDSGGFLGKVSFAVTGVEETYGYDEVGRRNSIVDGRGAKKTRVFDSHDQLLSSTDALGHKESYSYNGNGNLVIVRAERWIPNVDSADGTLSDGEVRLADAISVFQYDILGKRVVENYPVQGRVRAVVHHRYDKGGNRVLTLKPERRNDKSNVESTVFDERGLVLQMTMGGLTNLFGSLPAHADLMADPLVASIPDAPNAPGQLVSTSHFYDDYGNETLLIDEEGYHWTANFDSFQRRISESDPEGNERVYDWDAAMNLVRERAFTGSAVTGTLIEDTHYRFDSRGRRFQTDQALFALGAAVAPVEGSLSPDDGFATTRYRFDNESRVTNKVTDHRRHIGYEYDLLGRVIREFDGAGDQLGTSTWATAASAEYVYIYDTAGNMIQSQRFDYRRGGSFLRSDRWSFFDLKNRMTATVNAAGHTRRMRYDESDRIVFESDAESLVTSSSFFSDLDGASEHLALADPAPSMALNDHGNAILRTYDNRGLELSVRRFLRVGGLGEGALDATAAGDGIVETLSRFDLNGRLIEEVDDNGKSSIYGYDALDRRYSTKSADGTVTLVQQFWKSGLPRFIRDPNGTVVSMTYDKARRMTKRIASHGAGVGVGIFATEDFGYDGNGNIVWATDDDSSLARIYDSMGRVAQETVNGLTIHSAHDSDGKLREVITASGRKLEYSYDVLDRLHQVSDQTAGSVPIASFGYLGRKEELRFLQPHAQGALAVRDLTFNPLHQVIDSKFIVQGALSDHRTNAWSRAGNRKARHDLLSGVIHQYSYDSVYQMVRSDRNGSVADRQVDYEFDGVGNRITVTGGILPGSYGTNDVNGYVSTPLGAAMNDNNGNRTTDQGAAVFDFRNQMIQYTNRAGLVAIYTYDALGRRVSKTFGGSTTRYSYLGWNVCEELDDGTSALLAGYVTTGSLDDWLQMIRDTDGDGIFESYYYYGDDLKNTLQLVRGDGVVVDRFDYDDYGLPLDGNTYVFRTDGSSVENPYLFSGRRYDTESSYYYFRHRYLDPISGRFTTVDPIGVWGDEANWGNGYTYVGNNPWSAVDRLGLKKDSTDDEKKEKEKDPKKRKKELEEKLKKKLKDLKKLRDEGKLTDKQYKKLRDATQGLLDAVRNLGSNVMQNPYNADAALGAAERLAGNIDSMTDTAVAIGEKYEQIADKRAERQQRWIDKGGGKRTEPLDDPSDYVELRNLQEKFDSGITQITSQTKLFVQIAAGMTNTPKPSSGSAWGIPSPGGSNHGIDKGKLGRKALAAGIKKFLTKKNPVGKMLEFFGWGAKNGYN